MNVKAFITLGLVTLLLPCICFCSDKSELYNRDVSEREANGYTITSVFEMVGPLNIADMNDDFQEARLISKSGDLYRIEVKSRPYARQVIEENPRWREQNLEMQEYLQPTVTENWDKNMREALIKELATAGIFPDQLSDRELVKRVSRWALRRAKFTPAFIIWTIHFPNGSPAVLPTLRDAFETERRRFNLSEAQMIDQEVLGRSMFYGKIHGACTSYTVYMATILRALGIPTRMVFCIPPFDTNDPTQADLFFKAVSDPVVSATIRKALNNKPGFQDHIFHEVYIGQRWIRLNYDKLGQPILDPHYLGLQIHILTTASYSQVPLAESWGMRYFKYPANQPPLSSVNPYRLVSVSEYFSKPNGAAK